MRCTLFISVFISIFPITQSLAYDLPDALILNRFQATCRHIMAHPTLWQVRHPRQAWTDAQTRYELLVEYTEPNRPPKLTLFHGSHRYHIESKPGSGERRELVLKGPLPLQSQTQAPEIETTQGVSPHPLGTFDFVSILPFSDRFYRALFTQLSAPLFSGQLRIWEGLPMWIYDTQHFPWRMEMPRHHFFPQHLVWKNSSRIIIQWDFKTHIDYKPWGIAGADLTEVTYQEADNSATPPLIKTQALWTLDRTFRSAGELEAWRSKKKSASAHTPVPWLPSERLNILSAY